MKNLRKNLYDYLEIPREICTKDPKITVTGFNEIFIENYKGIFEYEEDSIKVNTHIGLIHIRGCNLNLTQMTGDDILVKGKIENIELESLT